MPEGDTLRKIAAFMAPRLVGRALGEVRVAGVRQPELAGRVVQRVWAEGKHLLIWLGEGARGWVLRSHLGMHGTWHSYPPGRPYARPPHTASLALVTAGGVHYVCFGAEDADCIAASELARDPTLAALGPNLLEVHTPDGRDTLQVALGRLSRRPATTLLIDALLDQSIAAGFGNVYKCELAFYFGVDVHATLSQLTPALRAALWRQGMQWLAANLGGWARTTTVDRRVRALPPGTPRLYVYARKGQPCLRCAGPVARAELGRHRRPTYFCPRCQPPRAHYDVAASPPYLASK